MVRYLVPIALVALSAGCVPSPKPQEEKPVVMAAAVPTVQGAAVNGPTAYWSYVNPEGQKATYGAQLSQAALLAGANLGVQGSATKLVKVTHVAVGPCTSTDGGVQDVNFRIFTGFLTTDAAAFFLISGYGYGVDAGQHSTAQYILPLSGFNGLSLSASLRSNQLYSMPTVGLATMTSTTNVISWDFCRGVEMCPTITGTDQIAVINVSAGGALAGQKCDEEIVWTEE